MHKTTAIYPGSFDPPTNGHLDLIERGSKIFDELIVAILRNPDKDPLFNVNERVAMLEALTGQYSNVRVDTFDGLTVDYAVRVGASSVLRGIRALSDYEYELQMALMNRKLRPELETVFQYLSTHFPVETQPALNLNTATSVELESVAGLLRKESAALIAHREKNGPCKKLEDLKKVVGLDYRKIEARKERLTCT